jgi:tetratricopeptide (TPR) repeat protein
MNENNNIDDFVKKVLQIKNEQEKNRLSQNDLNEIAQELGLDQASLEKEITKYQERGEGFLAHQNYEDAIVALEQAYILNSENLETLKKLLQAYFEAWKQDKNANYKEKALAKAEEILEQIPDYEKAFEVISVIKQSNQEKKTQSQTNTSLKKSRKIGDTIKVQWNDKIYDATIIDIEGFQYKIRYAGYSDYWNEWITEKRIPSVEKINKIKLENKKNIIKGLIILFIAVCIFLALSYLGKGFVYKLIHKTPANSVIYTNTYKIGDKVKVSWKGTYYNATIIDKYNSQYKISYDGYGSSWDEWVYADRIKPR